MSPLEVDFFYLRLRKFHPNVFGSCFLILGIFSYFCSAISGQAPDALPTPTAPRDPAVADDDWKPLVLPAKGDLAQLEAFVVEAKKRRPRTLEQYLEMQRAIRECSKRIVDLVKDSENASYQAAEFDYVASSVMMLANDGPQAQEKTFERFREYLGGRKELNIHDIRMALLAGQNLEQLEDTTLAKKAYNDFAEIIAGKEKPEFEEMVELLRASARRLELPGNDLSLEGKLLSTQESWNLEKLRGKHVLVVIWSPKSPPSIEEIKFVRRLYQAYRDVGFTVVGMATDTGPDEVEQARQEMGIDWLELGDREAPGQHSFVKAYGVTSIPTMILVDDAGNVISLQARGQALATMLDRIYHPDDQTDR